MDVQRDPVILTRKRRRRAVLAVLVGLGIVALTVAVSRLEPALPSVSDSTLWLGTVKRGPMVRQVRGAGTLAPEEIRWITATASGRVDRIVLQPGARVEPGTVMIELANPDLRQTVLNAEMDWQTAQAQLANQRATLANARLAQQSSLTDAESNYTLAQVDMDLNRSLADKGLVAEFAIRQKQAALEQMKNRVDLARRQLANAEANQAAQLAPAEAAVNQRRAEFQRVSRQLTELQVRSTMSGLLQAVMVEVGQQVGPGMNLVRVSDPARLKAEIRIPETQTKDLAIGQMADVDTRNGHIAGRVSRIDPASQNGTVGVDITLDGALPPGARPDSSIDATIELERLANVLFVESPAFGQEHATLSLFRITGPREAARSSVTTGRRSVQFVEVVNGLREGDRVILSDMSQYDAFDRIRLD